MRQKENRPPWTKSKIFYQPTPKMKRLLLFLFACIPIRLFVAIKLTHVPALRPFLVAALLAVATRWAFGSFGPTGFFGGNVFWKDLRIVHAALYVLAAASLLGRSPRAAEGLLVLDAMLGVAAKVLLDANSP